MSSTPRNAMGSRQTVSSELTPREFHPNCRSDRAALIACNVVGADSAIVGLPQAARLLRSIAPPLPKKPFGFWGAPIRSDCDWTGVPLFSLWVMAKSGAARYFESVRRFTTFLSLAAIRQVMAYRCTRSCSSQSQRGSVWRMGIRLSRNCPRFRHTKENRQRVFIPSPVSTLRSYK